MKITGILKPNWFLESTEELFHLGEGQRLSSGGGNVYVRWKPMKDRAINGVGLQNQEG